MLSIRVYILILNDGPHHLNGVVLMCKKTTIWFLDDGARRRHQAFAYPVFGLRRWWLLGEPLLRSGGHLFGRVVVLPATFLFGAPLPTTLGADEDALFSVCLLFLFPGSSNPHLRSLPSSLHFYKGQVTSIRTNNNANRKRGVKVDKLTMMGVSIKATSCWCWLGTPTLSAWSVECNEIPTLPLVQRDLCNPTNKSFLLVYDMQTNTS